MAARQQEVRLTATATLIITEWPDRCDEACTVWDAGLILAHYLADGRGGGWKEKMAGGARVIDLGSGTGLVGLTAAALGANTVLTDLAECLEILKLNTESNAGAVAQAGGAAAVLPLRWGDEEDIQQCLGGGAGFDVVLCGDCMYHTGESGPAKLVSTVVQLLARPQQQRQQAAPPPTVIVANERRLQTATVVVLSPHFLDYYRK